MLTCCSAELAVMLCQLLVLNEDLTVADKAAQLLSVVNLRILAKPVTHDVKLWEYLHVLLVFVRSRTTRPDQMKRFGYAFHLELMVPLLNLLLRRLKDRGGDAWEALFRPEFPTLWVSLNAKDKPEKYDKTTNGAQREYLVRKQEQEAKSAIVDETPTEAKGSEEEREAGNTNTDSVILVSTADITKIAAEDGSSTSETVASKAETNTEIAAEGSAEKPRANVDTENVHADPFKLEVVEVGGVTDDNIKHEPSSAKAGLQSETEDIEHETENKPATDQGATASDAVSESGKLV